MRATPDSRSFRLVALGSCLALLTGCAARSKVLSQPALTQLSTYPLLGDTRPVHDPSLIRQGENYYVFSSDPRGRAGQASLPIRCSQDEVTWARCGHVFAQIPAWVQSRVPGGLALWAPDISFFGGLYHLYYAGSTTGSQRSVIGLATSPTLDQTSPAYAWTDRGEVLASQPGMDFNAIDPNILVDTDGSVWLTYGSFWSGIKQLQLDPATGAVLAGARRYDLAARNSGGLDPIEGASLVHHGAYYYLFVSIDFCCNPDVTTDNYKEAFGRGTTPHGPFTDRNGKPMLRGGGTVILAGNGAGNSTWNAPGGGSVYIDPETGTATLAFHALDMQRNGATNLWLKQIEWQDDWPVLAPQPSGRR